MAKLGGLYFTLGADVQAAIQGLKATDAAAKAVSITFQQSIQKYDQAAQKIAVWSVVANQAFSQVNDTLANVDVSGLDDAEKKSLSNIKSITKNLESLTRAATVASSSFSVARQTAGAFMTGIARLAPQATAAIAAMSGPIGIIVGGLAALTAGYFTWRNAQAETVEVVDKLKQKLIQQQAETNLLISIVKDSTLTFRQKNAQIEQYNKNTGSNISLLNQQATNIGAVVTQLERANEVLFINIQLEARKERLLELERQRIVLVEKYQQALQQEQNAINASTNQLERLKANESSFNQARERGAVTTAKKITNSEKSIAEAREVSSNAKKSIEEIDNLRKKEKEILGDLNAELLKYKTKIAANKIEPISIDTRITIPSEDSARLAIINKLHAEIQKIEQRYRLWGDAAAATEDKIRYLTTSATELVEIGVDPNDEVVVQLLAQITELKNVANTEIPTIFVDPLALAQANFQAGMQQIAASFEVFQDPARAAREEMSLIQDTINELLANGVPAHDDFIQSLISQYKNLQKEAETTWKQIVRQFSKGISLANNIANGLEVFTDGDLTARRQDLENFYQRERELIEESNLTQRQKAQLQESLDKKADKAKRKLARDEARANRDKEAFQAAVAGARAAVAAGPNPFAIAAMLAFTAAQVAFIKSRPLPALAQGGIAFGPTAALVGEYPGANVNPEVIAPLNKLQNYIVEAVVSAGGGGSLYGVIKGDDLHLLQEKQNYITKRTR